MSSRAQAVLIGGSFIGVLSALPIISLANICCTWVIGGGVVAAYLLQQGQPGRIRPGDGAVVGCLAGVCGAFVYVIVSVPVQLVVAPMQRRMAGLFTTNADVPPEVLELMELLGSSGLIVVFLGFVMMLMLGLVFSTVGGLVGGVIFSRDRVPASPAVPSSE